ncbi:MAG: hypothetical protein ABFD54_05870 [Armatimonadota bacterium]|nr:hypothetical protein [bacterium]
MNRAQFDHFEQKNRWLTGNGTTDVEPVWRWVQETNATPTAVDDKLFALLDGEAALIETNCVPGFVGAEY